MSSIREKAINTIAWTKDNKLKIAHKSTRVVKILFRTLFLVGMGFVMLYPILFMISQSFMSINDVRNQAVIWIPAEFSIRPIQMAITSLDLGGTVPRSLYMTIPSVICQVLTCMLTAYGFARYRFPGSKVLFGLLIFQIIVPISTLTVPLYALLSQMGLLSKYYLFWIMAVLGNGIRSALYIFMLRQFFKQIPKELEEAARIDGCGHFGTFLRIMIPNVIPGIVTIATFSTVWYWNDYYYSKMFIPVTGQETLSVKLDQITTLFTSQQSFFTSYYGISQAEIRIMMENVVSAACLITIAPMVILYIILQRQLTESIEKTGLVG